MFLSGNYRLIVAPRKFDVLKTNSCPERSFSSKYASFKNIKFPWRNYRTDSSETLTLCCLYCSPLNFLLRANSKIILNLIFNLFRWKPLESNVKFEKRKQRRSHLIKFQLFIFYKPACLQKNFHGRLLSIRVFSSDGLYGLIVSLRGWTLSRHAINFFQ